MKIIKRVIPFLCALIIFIISFIPFLTPKKSVDVSTVVLRLWNIDGFEGGKGSRTEFLKRVSISFQKQTNIIVMVENITKESYYDGLSKGIVPDLLSFGCGISLTSCCKLDLYDLKNFTGNEKCFAYPWCRGVYVLYTLKEDFSIDETTKIVVAQGKDNIPELSIENEKIIGEIEFKPAVSAYVDLLNGKYDYYLGTQRDHYRFAARNVVIKEKVLTEYSDLFQYVCICKSERYQESMSFIRYLLNEKNQNKLGEIGLFGMDTHIYLNDEDLYKMERSFPKNILNCCIDSEIFRKQMTSDEKINPEKMYVKYF